MAESLITPDMFFAALQRLSPRPSDDSLLVVAFVRQLMENKRDTFAGLAMQAQITNGGKTSARAIAETAYKVADFMIEESKKSQEVESAA